MRELELVTLACGLGSFPYIVFPPVAFPDPNFCSREPNLMLDLPVEEVLAVPEPIAVAEPVAERREPVLARALPPAPPAVEADSAAASTPVQRPETSLTRVAEVLELLRESAPEPPAAPFQILTDLHSTIGRTPRRPLRRQPRGAPIPAAKVALAKTKPN